MLSLTCAGLGAAEEDDDGAVIGYAKSDHCLGTAALPRFLRFFGSGSGLAPFLTCGRVFCWLICALRAFFRHFFCR